MLPGVFLKASVIWIQKPEQDTLEVILWHAIPHGQDGRNETKNHITNDQTAQLSSVYPDVKGGLTSEDQLT